MTAVAADLVARSGDLKRDLVEFGKHPRFAKALRGMLRGAGHRDIVSGDEDELINTLDFFVLQHRLAGGLRVVDHFVAAHPDLPEQERQMLLGWRDVVEGLFEVRGRDGSALQLFNLVDELTYQVHSNTGTAVFAQMPQGSFVVTRLVPVGDEWLFSGSQRVLPASARREIARLAAEFSTQRPALVFRNPEKLRGGWEIHRKYRARFIEFFGADLVVLPGAQVAEQMRAYWEHCIRRITDERGDRAGGPMPVAPDLQLPPNLIEAATVGVIYDEVDGLNFYAEFGLVAEAFANPELIKGPYRRRVRSYLNDDSVSPLPFRRLAEQDTAKASRLFQLLLKRPSFSWEADGEALLRRRKPAFFDRPALPGITPLGGIALEHYHSATSEGSEQLPGRIRHLRAPG
ncbi:MAG: hypothetical protein ACRDYA_01990 [Egibacteraceae bacterium]